MPNQFKFEPNPLGLSNENGKSNNNPRSIRRLQQALSRALGIQLPIDGVMSFRTRRAIRNFQRQKGLPVDGMVISGTFRALFANTQKEMGLNSESDFDPGTGSDRFLNARGSRYKTSMEAEISFGSPRRTPRPVRANFVSCNPPSPAIAAITGPNPVAVIQAANTRAIELLDRAINQLQDIRNRIRRGTATRIVPRAMRNALRLRFGMNANDRNIWTRTSRGSIYVLIRRIRGARQILADGWMKYTCLGAAAPATVTISRGGRRCTVEGCAGERAFTCGGNSHIVLCVPWWRNNTSPLNRLDSRARTLLHECFHIYFEFIGDAGNLTNAHCYDQFVLALNGLQVPVDRVGSCP